MNPRSIALVAAAIAIAGGAGRAISAEIKGFAYPCGENQGTVQICSWHQVVVPAPKGWIEDEAWTKRYRALTLFPNGDKSKSKPLIYVRTHYGDKTLSIEDDVAGAQEKWKKKMPDSTIEAQPDLVRTGKPTFKMVLSRTTINSETTSTPRIAHRRGWPSGPKGVGGGPETVAGAADESWSDMGNSCTTGIFVDQRGQRGTNEKHNGTVSYRIATLPEPGWAYRAGVLASRLVRRERWGRL